MQVNGIQEWPVLRSDIERLRRVQELRHELRCIAPNAAMYYGWAGPSDDYCQEVKAMVLDVNKDVAVLETDNFRRLLISSSCIGLGPGDVLVGETLLVTVKAEVLYQSELVISARRA